MGFVRFLVFAALLVETISVAESQYGDTNFDAKQLNVVLKRIEQLENIVKDHPSEMAALKQMLEKKFEDRLAAIEDRYNAMLKEQKLNLDTQIDGLKRELKNLAMENRKSSVLSPEHKTDLTEDYYNGDEDTMDHENDAFQWLAKLSNVPRIRRYEPEVGPVGFFATLSADLPHLGQHQAVIFDRVITNVGTAYNPKTGMFIASAAGVYIFSTTVVTHGNENTRYGFHKNGSWLATIAVHGSSSSYDDGSQTIVLLLAKGDAVMVGHVDSDHTLQGGNVSLFSGALISQIFDDTTVPIIGK